MRTKVRASRSLFITLFVLLLVGGLGASTVQAQEDGVWINYITGDEVNDLAVQGNYLWAATTGGVVRWDRSHGTYVHYTTRDGLADNWVFGVAIDGEGHKWFATAGGVSEFDGTTWTNYTDADGMFRSFTVDIAIDSTGDLWVAYANDGGAGKFDGANWTHYTSADGLACDSVYVLGPDNIAEMWFAYENYYGCWGATR